jgi:ketosteroid isomerase-like protein
MHPNAELVTRFYTAFQKHDGPGMAACYHPDIAFSDDVFPDLRGAKAGGMWRMFCANAKESQIRVEFSDVTADDTRGSAHWQAWYIFRASGRNVHNTIRAEFEFKDGKIWKHRDSFDFHKWSRQALGPAGLLLGWTGFLKNKIRKTAGNALDAYVATNPG